MKSKTYCFDFDGVITIYSGPQDFKGDDHVMPPREEVLKAIRLLKEQGHKIIIFSTRSKETLRKYCEENSIPFDYLNENPEFDTGNPGKPVATAYIDDRAFTYAGQSAEELIEQLSTFKPFYKNQNN